MISLSENRTALANLAITIEAIERFDVLIEYYDDGKVGPAYVCFRHTSRIYIEAAETQIDRSIIVEALRAQRQKLVDYLADLGIDATK